MKRQAIDAVLPSLWPIRTLTQICMRRNWWRCLTEQPRRS